MDHTQSRRILVIDDSIDAQNLLRVALESKNYFVNCSSNGEEALALLRSLDELPDVILVDLRMPVMDGYEFLRSMHLDPKLQAIPTIVMSADGDLESSLIRLQSPPSTRPPLVLTKPLSIGGVFRAIEQQLGLLHAESPMAHVVVSGHA